MPRKMRYLSERKNGDYRYVRDFPTKLLKAIPSHPKQFSRELGLNKTCTDTEILRAMEEATTKLVHYTLVLRKVSVRRTSKS